MNNQILNIGDKVTCLQAGSAGVNAMQKNKTYTIARAGFLKTGQNITIFREGNSGNTWSVYSEDFERSCLTITDLEKNRDFTWKTLNDMEDKIRYMKESKTKTFDLTKFKEWKLLRIIKDGGDDVPQLITHIFDG